MRKDFEYEFLGKKIVVETGELAKQANGAVLVRYEDTVILSTAVMSNNVSTADFFPLTILYQEKLYSVGKIPGGFIKREGRPTDAATLTARVIDRPIRPMFDENFRNEVQVVNTVLSVDNDYTPEMTALFGTSLALGISSIPFDGPVAGVKVGKIDGVLKINPTVEEMERSTIDLTVAGTKNAINMVESGSKEVSEEEMLEALMFGHEHIKELCAIQEDIINEVGKEKITVELASLNPEIVKEVESDIKNDMVMAIQIKDKLEKYAKIDELKERIVKENLNTYRSNQVVRAPKIRMFKSKKVRKTRMTGLQRQYFREMYRLGKIRKQPYSQVWKYRKDVKKFQLLQKQYLFLARYDVTDVEQISDVQKDLRKKVSVLLKAKKVIVNEMDKHLKVFQAVENIDKEKKATIFYKMGDDTFKESEQIVSEARATLKEEGLSFEEAKKLKEYYTELLQANEKETKQLRKEIVVGYKIIKEVKVRQENKEIEERAIKEEKNKQEEQEKKYVKRK